MAPFPHSASKIWFQDVFRPILLNICLVFDTWVWSLCRKGMPLFRAPPRTESLSLGFSLYSPSFSESLSSCFSWAFWSLCSSRSLSSPPPMWFYFWIQVISHKFHSLEGPVLWGFENMSINHPLLSVFLSGLGTGLLGMPKKWGNFSSRKPLECTHAHARTHTHPHTPLPYIPSPGFRACSSFEGHKAVITSIPSLAAVLSRQSATFTKETQKEE